MLSHAFNNTLRDLLAPKGVAKWPFDPSSGLLVPQEGSFKDLGTSEIQNLTRFGFKRTLRDPRLSQKNENPSSGGGPVTPR